MRHQKGVPLSGDHGTIPANGRAGSSGEPILGEADFARLSRFIESQIGIKMPVVKKVMVEARLRKRLRALDLVSYKGYVDYLFSPLGQQEEVVFLLDAVTTNKTDFFREAAHFGLLTRTIVPVWLSRQGPRPLLRVWSAGCATGEEPYTLAMVLAEFARDHQGFDFTILGTDVSTKVLDTAQRAIYDLDRIEPIPTDLRRRYLMRSKDPARKAVRIVPELRQKVRLQRLNLMDEDLGLRESFEVIFLRNVLIYFERPHQEALVNRICRHLAPGGHLFVGHSETLMNMTLPLAQVAQMVYRKL